MKGISIKIKEGYVFSGDGEKIGKDIEGNSHTFWKGAGIMEVPVELAMKLENEIPQRFEIIDRDLAKNLIVNFSKEVEKVEIVNSELKETLQVMKDTSVIDVNNVLDQVEKAIALSKSEQLNLLNKLNIVPDKKGKEFDRVRKIISSGIKL